MKIQVLSHYDHIETIDVRELRRMIADGKVLAFRRSDGWVKVGSEPLRGDGGADYNGPERRNFRQKPLTEEQIRSGHHCVVAVSGPDSDW